MLTLILKQIIKIISYILIGLIKVLNSIISLFNIMFKSTKKIN